MVRRRQTRRSEYPHSRCRLAWSLSRDFTNRNTTFMTWNLLHLTRMLKDAGGIPAHGNQRGEWDAGCRFDFANPEYS